ncbi:YcxB family protein [Micromonospora sp. NPDC050686]|uniref:YcxB family protein n=1 Tax=Micromonospora sp. NPDC050686 TaxID=3154631 RepID=UPI003404E11C
MVIEFTYQRDRAYARRLARATTTRLRITCAVVGLSAACAGFGAFTADPGWAVLCGMVGLWVGGTFLLTALMLPWQVARRAPATSYRTFTYRVDDEGLAWASSDLRSWVRWTYFARVTERPFCYLLWQEGGHTAWDIPRAPLTPEQDRRLADLLTERVRPATRTAVPVPAAGQAEPPAEPELRPDHQVRPSAPAADAP